MAPTFTEEQLAQFLSHIEIPEQFRLDKKPQPDIAFLTALHVHMITAVPYDNLLLHYSKDRSISLDPQKIFHKVVTEKRGRGGYCMESSLFFLYILRDLGFDVYPVGAKSRPRKDGVPHGHYMGWVHIVNIVTLRDGTRWMTDVSFGGDGATQPIRLEGGAMIRNMGTQDARLVRDFIPGQEALATPDKKYWVYECRNGPDKPWRGFHCFHDAVEWQPADFEVLNWYTSAHDVSPMRRMVLLVKFLRRPSESSPGGQEIYGKRMLVDGVVKENLGGRTAVVQTCTSEEERVQAMREWFGLELTEEERVSIKGHISELKP
ncbi:Arylamine N-acetyltransferase, liver isozyme [Paramyrothecium foliicola]|nr:Arylamine N-acetyltransferase, liver isozyme [Paramyrothecium foliicola]